MRSFCDLRLALKPARPSRVCRPPPAARRPPPAARRPPPTALLSGQERIEADIAMLEWLKLAAGAGELAFTEDVMALGGEVQLQRLKAVRGTRNLTEARAIYVDEKQAVVDTEGNVDYVGVDRMLAREDALAPGTETGAADPMDDVD